MREYIVNFMDEEITVAFWKSAYEVNKGLYIGCICKNEDGEWEDFCDVTKNMPMELSENYPMDHCGLLDSNNLPECIYNLFVKNNWLSILGVVTAPSSFCKYPLVLFSDELLNDVCITEFPEA